MTAGRQSVRATFWLLDAPDSLAEQSRREPDGTGIGTFGRDGRPEVVKQPLAAYQDRAFAREARELTSPTFVAHVRYASNGGLTLENTHPFEQDGRLFAHNGVIGDLGALEAELGPGRSLVHGETDSERFFALITRETERTGDVGEGITAAARWIAERLPVFALNCVLITPTDLWALRYPDVHDLFVLEREAGGSGGGRRHLEHASARGSVRVRSGDLAGAPAVIVATERMDEDPGWRELGSGQLLHVDQDLVTTITTALPHPPAHPIALSELDPRAAQSQGGESHA